MLINSSLYYAIEYLHNSDNNARVVSNKLASVGSTERIDESLMIINNTLRYVFRLAGQTSIHERYAIVVSLNDISSVVYDDKLRALTINGNLDYEYYENYTDGNNPDVEKTDAFTISDYFTPNLKDFLESECGLIVKYNQSGNVI